MKYKVILKDGTYGEINCSDYDNVPDFAWHKYGDDWSEIIRPGSQKTSKEKLKKIEYVKTKKIPVEIPFKTKDGKTIKIKATKVVRDS